MIPVKCKTNFDEYKGKKFPNFVCCPPRVGDRMMAEDGTTAVIVSITHKMVQEQYAPITSEMKPILQLELHTFVPKDGQ
jgi:hypothetical protein